MRIAFIEHKLNLITGGGSNITLFNMAAGLKALHHDVSVVTIAPHNNAFRDDLPFTVVAKALTGGDAAGLVGRLAVVRLLRQLERSVDVFQIETPSLIMAGALYKWLGGKVPVVARLHNYSFFCTNIERMDTTCARSCSLVDRIRHRIEPRWRKILLAPIRAAEHWLTRLTVNQIDRFIALSPAVAEIHALQGMDPRKLVIITPPLDEATLPVERPDRRQRARDTNRLYRIVYVGRLTSEKGIETLLRAAAGLGFPFSLEIFGSGSERDELESVAIQLGIASQVTFHGWKSQREIFDAFLAADLFVHPARWPEPAGRTVLEAMALGIPMIVSDVGGPPWLAGEAALTFTPGDIRRLQQRIVELHNDPELATTLAAAGRLRVKQFSLERILKQLTVLYEEIGATPAAQLARSQALGRCLSPELVHSHEADRLGQPAKFWPWLLQRQALAIPPGRDPSGAWRAERTVKRPKYHVVVVGIVALLARLIVVLTVPVGSVDIDGWITTTRHIAENGLSSAYSVPQRGNLYPPGFFYPLWLIGLALKGGTESTGQPDPLSVELALRMLAILVDTAVAVAVYRFATLISDRRAALTVGLLYACNPAVLLNVAWASQIGDPYYLLLVLLAFMAILQGWTTLGGMLLAGGVTVKPQALAFVPYGAFLLWTRSRPWPLAKAALGGVLILALVVTPFVLGRTADDAARTIMGMGSLFPFVHVRAHNLWYALSGGADPWGELPTLWSLTGASDTRIMLLYGITLRDVGIVAFATVYSVMLYLNRGRKSTRGVVSTLAVISYAFFILCTRMHVNYSFPTLALVSVLAASHEIRFRLILAAISTSSVVNWLIYEEMLLPVSLRTVQYLSVANSVAAVFLLGGLIASAVDGIRREAVDKRRLRLDWPRLRMARH